MSQVLERETVRDAPLEEALIEAPQREPPTVPPTEETPPPESGVPEPRRPIRWMRWLAGVLVILVGAGVAYLALSDGDSGTPTAAPRSADGAEGWLAETPVTVVVPRSADGAEGWLAETPVTVVVPRSADGAEGWLESAD